MIRRFPFWLVLDSNIRLGPLAPWVLGLAIGRLPHRVKTN